MIERDRQAMFIETLYAFLGTAIILLSKHFASTSDAVMFTQNMAMIAFLMGLIATLVIRHFSPDLIIIAVPMWIASLILFGIGISNSLVDASWQANLILAILALIMLDTDCATSDYGPRPTPFSGSAFVATIIALAICI